MKILHMADNHYSDKNLEQVDKCTMFAIETAIKENVDVAIIAGDYLDEYGVSIKVEDMVLDRAVSAVRSLADHCPVLMLQGTYSHERPKCLNIFGKLKTEHEVFIADKIGQVFLDTSNCFWHTSDCGAKIVFSTLPPVDKAHLIGNRKVELKETNHEIQDLLLDIFRGFGVENDKYDCLKIMVGHGSIAGALVSEGQTLIGHDIICSVDDLKQARADLYCFGHYHYPSSIWDRGFYAGSICRLGYGEEEQKGFWIHEIEEGA